MPLRHTIVVLTFTTFTIALAGCARATTATTALPVPTVLPTLVTLSALTTLPVPTAQPTLTEEPARDEGDMDETYVALSLKTWIDAIETGNDDLAGYVYHLKTGTTRSEIRNHITALHQFIANGEDPGKTDFGTYLGFHEIVGSYSTAPGRRVGLALMRFERATICFRADLAQYDDFLWSVEQWEPINGPDCDAELARTPARIREEWRASAASAAP